MEIKRSNADDAQNQNPSWRLRVRWIAQTRGFDLDSLIAASGMSKEDVKVIWEDPTADASLSTLDSISGILGVNITDLIEVPPET